MFKLVIVWLLTTGNGKMLDQRTEIGPFETRQECEVFGRFHNEYEREKNVPRPSFAVKDTGRFRCEFIKEQ